MYEEADCFAASLLDLKEPAVAPALKINVVGGPIK